MKLKEKKEAIEKDFKGVQEQAVVQEKVISDAQTLLRALMNRITELRAQFSLLEELDREEIEHLKEDKEGKK